MEKLILDKVVQTIEAYMRILYAEKAVTELVMPVLEKREGQKVTKRIITDLEQQSQDYYFYIHSVSDWKSLVVTNNRESRGPLDYSHRYTLYLIRPNFNPSPEDYKINIDFIKSENIHRFNVDGRIKALGMFLSNDVEAAVERYNSLIDDYHNLREALPHYDSHIHSIHIHSIHYPISTLFDLENRNNDKYHI
jgi:hypothetical protein